MSKFEKQAFENVDISKSELKEFGEALKKEEFRKLLNDYFTEVTDPKNRAEYEKDMIKLEKERGVDITFVHPTPGYVIKTSCDGERKAFINICSNNLVDRPIPTTVQLNGHIGTNWSLPHIFVPPRIDVDKKQERCVVFDVIFHPETLELAKRNQDFKNFVNDTALSGIEDSFDTKLDRNNLRFPKMDFKGAKTASVIRKKCEDMPASGSNESPMDIPNYPYGPITENPTPKVTKLRGNVTKESSPYTTPKYVIKHRKGVDFHECSTAFDAKVNAATPSELVVEIDLPLLSSTEDATLKVCERSLSLISEKPSKYKLDISLPYAVDESNGTARFDKRSKMLIVTLPVVQKKFNEDLFHRDDSGIESDVNQNPSSSDEDPSTPSIEVISACDFGEQKCNEEGIDFRTSEEVVCKFLSEDVHYVFPTYSFSNDNKSISITIDVKNVDPSTVYHQFVFDGAGVHFKFSSLGSGFFPIHYAFCIKFPKASINPSTMKVDVWDNNLIIMLDLISCEDNVLTQYAVGTTLDKLQEISLQNPIWFKDIYLTNKLEKEIVLAKSLENGNTIVTKPRKTDRNFEQVEINVKVKDVVEEEISNNQVEQLCHGVSDVDINSDLKRPVNADNQKIVPKPRTCSETNFRPPPVAIARRSILKNSRSLSESNTDEYSTWSSLDSSDNQDESLGNCTIKKTVRFSDVISKKVFRAGSSILGQKHKNEKKARNRKKVAIKRRRSESDASEVSEVSDISDYSEISDMSETSDGGSSDDSSSPLVRHPPPIPGSKRHRRRGSKNGRKNAASAKQNNFLLSHD